MAFYWLIREDHVFLMDDDNDGWHYAEIIPDNLYCQANHETGEWCLTWWPISENYESTHIADYPTPEEARKDLEDALSLKDVPIEHG